MFTINPEDMAVSELITKHNRNSMTNASYLTLATLEYVFICFNWSFRLNAGSYRLARPTMRYTLP